MKRDRFILSAGHKCLGLYGTLIEKGFENREVMATYNQLGTIVPGHPDMKKFTGVDFSSGSLGHGLPIGSGMPFAEGSTNTGPYRELLEAYGLTQEKIVERILIEIQQ